MAKRIDDNRIKHMHGVAEYMYNNAEKYGLNKEQMYVLGLLHDIGYVKEKAGHEQYGGDLLDDLFYIDAAIITWHGSTPKEYKDILLCDDKNIPKELVLLWEADMHIDLNGEDVGFEKRLEDIGNRLGTDSIAYKNCCDVVSWLTKNFDD